MSAFLDLWDRVELWLVTLPFAVQVCVMLLVGVPVALLAAVVLQRIVDLVAARLSAARLSTPSSSTPPLSTLRARVMRGSRPDSRKGAL